MKTFLMAIYLNLALCYLTWTQIPSSYKMNRFKYAFSKQNLQKITKMNLFMNTFSIFSMEKYFKNISKCFTNLYLGKNSTFSFVLSVCDIFISGRLKKPRPMAVNIFQAYIHPLAKNTNHWCETTTLKLREKVLNNTFQVHIDSKENHNPDVGCPQYKCKVNIKYRVWNFNLI